MEKDETMSDDDKLERMAICNKCKKLIPADEHRSYGGYCSYCSQKIIDEKEQERTMER